MFKKRRLGPSKTTCQLHTKEALEQKEKTGRFQFELMHIGLLIVASFFIMYELFLAS